VTSKWPWWSFFSWGCTVVAPVLLVVFPPSAPLRIWFAFHCSIVLVSIYWRFR
jgi:hypothetical protein